MLIVKSVSCIPFALSTFPKILIKGGFYLSFEENLGSFHSRKHGNSILL